MRRSREFSDPRLPSMSKIPPHFSETLSAARQRPASLSDGVCHYRRVLEDSLSGAEHLIERLLEMRCRPREIGADLSDVLLVALLYLFAEQLF